MEGKGNRILLVVLMATYPWNHMASTQWGGKSGCRRNGLPHGSIFEATKGIQESSEFNTSLVYIVKPFMSQKQNKMKRYVLF